MPILSTKYNPEYETSFFNEKTRKNKQVTMVQNLLATPYQQRGQGRQ